MTRTDIVDRIAIAHDHMNAAAIQATLALQQPEHTKAWQSAKADADRAEAELRAYDERAAAEQARIDAWTGRKKV